MGIESSLRRFGRSGRGDDTKSPRGLYGAIAILLVVPTAAVFSVAFDDEEFGVHVALAAGAFLLASAVFDFDVPRPINLLACVTTALLGGIFLLQAISPLTSSDGFHDFAYNTLGQWLEGTLTLAFVIWCFVMLLSDSKGRTRLLGLATVPLLLVYAAALWATNLADVSQPPGILKLLFMPVMVWLLLESRKPPREIRSIIALAPSRERPRLPSPRAILRSTTGWW